jgi:branched-subunit amino acid permease
MLAVAVFLLGLLAFLSADGGVSQTAAIILSVAAMVLAILILVGVGPALVTWRRGGPPA